MRLVPVPADDGASCDERERNVALVAVAGCLALALAVLLAALLASPELNAAEERPAAVGDGGAGAGSGGGAGTGAGRGSGSAGDGPGGGLAGGGAGRGDPAASGAPRGSVRGSTGSSVAEQPADEGEVSAVPRFGFTAPDETEPPAPRPAPAAGRRTGGDGGGASGAGGGSSGRFMDIQLTGRSVVFVLDHSSSLNDANKARVRAEVSKTLDSLPDGSRFGMVLMGVPPRGSSAGPMIKSPDGNEEPAMSRCMPPCDLVAANDANRRGAGTWMAASARDAQKADLSIGTRVWEAVALALRMEPEEIVILADGDFLASDVTNLRTVLAEVPGGRAPRIHTVAFGTEHDVESLQLIASENGGTYVRH
jgi:hypothetical protein